MTEISLNQKGNYNQCPYKRVNNLLNLHIIHYFFFIENNKKFLKIPETHDIDISKYVYWKEVSNFPMYITSTGGDIYSLKSKKLMSKNSKSGGYSTCKL